MRHEEAAGFEEVRVGAGEELRARPVELVHRRLVAGEAFRGGVVRDVGF